MRLMLAIPITEGKTGHKNGDLLKIARKVLFWKVDGVKVTAITHILKYVFFC